MALIQYPAFGIFQPRYAASIEKQYSAYQNDNRANAEHQSYACAAP